MARRYVDDFAADAADVFGLSWTESRDLLALLEFNHGFDRRTDVLADFGGEAADLLEYVPEFSDALEPVDILDAVRAFVQEESGLVLSENEAADVVFALEGEGFDPDVDSLDRWADVVERSVDDALGEFGAEDRQLVDGDDPYWDEGSEFEITAVTDGGTPKRK